MVVKNIKPGWPDDPKPPEPPPVVAPERIRVKKEEPKEVEKETAAIKLNKYLFETERERMPEMTRLSRVMAFQLSIQLTLQPKDVFKGNDGDELHDDDACPVDLATEWAHHYFALARSIDSEQIDRAGHLAEIEMAGGVDDDMDSMGMGQ